MGKQTLLGGTDLPDLLAKWQMFSMFLLLPLARDQSQSPAAAARSQSPQERTLRFLRWGWSWQLCFVLSGVGRAALYPVVWTARKRQLIPVLLATLLWASLHPARWKKPGYICQPSQISGGLSTLKLKFV